MTGGLVREPAESDRGSRLSHVPDGSLRRDGGPSDRPGVLRLSAIDNVLVALRELQPGEAVADGPRSFATRAAVPFGHKVAADDIDRGAAIVKYGEVVGRATQQIARGDHVHVHNVVSARLPGHTGTDPRPAARRAEGGRP